MMFGFYKKPCEHKRSQPVNITLCETLNIVNSDIDGELHREIHFCRDCRVLFLPWNKEKFKNWHEKKK